MIADNWRAASVTNKLKSVINPESRLRLVRAPPIHSFTSTPAAVTHDAVSMKR